MSSSASDKIVGAAFVLTVVVLHALVMGRAVWGLNIGLVAAYLLWAARAAARRQMQKKSGDDAAQRPEVIPSSCWARRR